MEHKKIEYKVKYRNIKYPRLEFRTKILQLILPFGADPKEMISKHINWIEKKQKFIADCLKDAERKKIVRRTEDEFRNLVFKLSQKDSRKLKVKVNKIYFKKMRTKWASCSAKKNLTINTMMKFLPENLNEYIIYHELVHLIERNHNKRFWDLISKRFRNYKVLENSLFSYWFLLYSVK
ncbi:M48 family metallopeptidase [candidate division WOR-3 bacterium]|nr:M48 family metallopeptidase [candidate division WOR-3 bacterium]